MGAGISNPVSSVPVGPGSVNNQAEMQDLGAPEPGSQQNTQGWKLGDPVCPVDRVSYTKRVAERINYHLNQIDKTHSFWIVDEKYKVSAGVAGIACNLHENWCLYGKVIENAIGGPVSRFGCQSDSCNNPQKDFLSAPLTA
jgi:hypothetical protein